MWPPLHGLPQTPQLFESEEVSTQFVPHSCWGALQLTLPPPPPVPGLPLPALPGLLPPEGLVQAAVRIAKPSPKRHTRAVFMTDEIPG